MNGNGGFLEFPSGTNNCSQDDMGIFQPLNKKSEMDNIYIYTSTFQGVPIKP